MLVTFSNINFHNEISCMHSLHLLLLILLFIVFLGQRGILLRYQSLVLIVLMCIWHCFSWNNKNTTIFPSRYFPKLLWDFFLLNNGEQQKPQCVIDCRFWNWYPNRINVRRVHMTPILWSKDLDCFEEGLDFSSFHYKVIFWSWTFLSSVWKIKPGKLHELSLKKYAAPVESNANV